jgi:hypothetical protein
MAVTLLKNSSGKLLGVQGYEVKLNQIVKGELITHEIDVTAKKGKKS